jgi:hypothetical protein
MYDFDADDGEEQATYRASEDPRLGVQHHGRF